MSVERRNDRQKSRKSQKKEKQRLTRPWKHTATHRNTQYLVVLTLLVVVKKSVNLLGEEGALFEDLAELVDLSKMHKEKCVRKGRNRR